MQFQTKSQQVICGYRQADSTTYMKRKNTQSSQHNIENEKQSWRIDSILFKIYDKAMLIKIVHVGKKKKQTNRSMDQDRVKKYTNITKTNCSQAKEQGQQSKNKVFSTNGAETTRHLHANNNNLDTDLTLFTNINKKWIRP